METSIVGVGVSISDRFAPSPKRSPSASERCPPSARLDVKVTHRAYHNGSREEETVELTVTGKGPLVRAEATDSDKFTALDMAVDKLAEQLRRAKDKRVDARNHPRGAKLDKERCAVRHRCAAGIRGDAACCRDRRDPDRRRRRGRGRLHPRS
jgi:ribosomal subunit interface protein